MNQPAKLVVVTRLGVGVYDPQWWSARLFLFACTALATMRRFADLDLVWHILLDRDMPPAQYGLLRELVMAAGLQRSVRFDFVSYHTHMRDVFNGALTSEASPDQRVVAFLIDDDDAVSDDFFQVGFTEISSDIGHSQVVALQDGLALDAPTGRFGSLRYVAQCNTLFYGYAHELHSLVHTPHVDWLETGARRGFRATAIETASPSFVYTYHQQGDGDYQKRVDAIKDWREFTPGIAKRFGIDEKALATWRDLQDATPPTLGLTWRRTQPQQVEMARLSTRLEELKTACRRTNSQIFGDDAAPFFYLLYPLDGQKRPQGAIAFHGVGSPGSRITLEVAGKSGVFSKMGSAICQTSTGAFGIRGNFRASTWRVRLTQELEGEKVNEMVTELHVTE